MLNIKKQTAALTAAVAVTALAGSALAVPYTITHVFGTRSASVSFEALGTDLVVVLTNTSANDALVPVDVLTAVFFDLQGAGALGSGSAVLSGGSSVSYDPDGQPAGGVVGGEWAYAEGLAGAPLSATRGISSAGFGLFGGPTFPGANLAPPAAIDGLQYGILPAGDLVGTGNGGITGSGGLINNQVTFTLTGLNPAFIPSASTISNVSFQYGTALSEPNSVVPEPTTLLALGTGLVALGAARRRSRKI